MASMLLPAGSMTSADQPPKSSDGEVRTMPPRNSSTPNRFTSGRLRHRPDLNRFAPTRQQLCPSALPREALQSENATVNGLEEKPRDPNDVPTCRQAVPGHGAAVENPLT